MRQHSARNKLPMPILSDAPADIQTAFEDFVTVADFFSQYDQGTIAARPVSTPANPGIIGRRYRATDDATGGPNGTIYLDTGTSWILDSSLADHSVSNAKLADDSVDERVLAPLSVGTPELIDGSVSTVKIADKAVTAAKLADTLKPSAGAAAGTEALRALGNAVGNAAAGLSPTISGKVTLPDQGNAGGLLIGGDATLYRSAVNALKTDGSLFAAGGFRIGAPIAGVAYQAQQVAAQTLIQNLLLGTDANAAFSILGDGKHQWGLGGANALDTNLYRGSAGVVKTDGTFNAVAGYQVAGAALASTHLTDSASLARLSGADLTITGKMTANGGYLIGAPLTGTPAYQAQQVAAQTFLRNKLLSADTQDTFHILGSGKLEWGPGGTTAVDTNLYRAAAGCLKTDSGMSVAGAGVPVSGASIEFGTTAPPSPVAYFQALDRGGVGAIPLHLQGSEVSLYDASVIRRFQINTSGVGFFNVTPVAQQGATTDLRQALINYGLLVGGGNTPLTLGGNIQGGSIYAQGGGMVAEGMVRAQGNSQGLGSAGGAVELQYVGGVGTVQSRDTGTGLMRPLQVNGLQIGFFGTTPTSRTSWGSPGAGGTGTRTLNNSGAETLTNTSQVVRQILIDIQALGLFG